MGKITVELIRKRAEHNEGEIHSLEELTLHQEKLEKIELVDRICKQLKILMLQNNAISKIENLGRLKALEYLNLALNSVERIENLEGCESLKKLDLTLNFIGEISTVRCLRPNYHLEQLYLVGNPCHEFPGYRDYIIVVLPQLKQLDGADVTRTEKLQARQKFAEVEQMVMIAEKAYLREKQEIKSKNSGPKLSIKDGSGDDIHQLGKDSQSDKEERELDDDDDDDDEEYWSKVSGNTPEARREMCRRLERQDEKKAGVKQEKVVKPARNYFDKNGQPFSCNEPKLSFTLQDDMERNLLMLDLSVQRHLCSTLLNVDVQPSYVRVRVKDKIFQLCLPEEVKPDSSYAQRSQTTGHLIITMSKVHENSVLVWKGGKGPQMIDLTIKHKDANSEPPGSSRKNQRHGEDGGASSIDSKTKIKSLQKNTKSSSGRHFSWNDCDHEGVPPLM